MLKPSLSSFLLAILFTIPLGAKDLASVIQFIPIQKDHNITNAEGGVKILSRQKIRSSSFAQVGRNTNYIIHPEEILAENFVLALEGELEVKDEWVVERIGGRLEKE